MHKFLSPAIPILVLFFAFALGCGLNFNSLVTGGVLGIFMGVAVVVFSGIILIIADKLTGGNGVAGLSAASTAGNSVAIPAALAAIDPVYAPMVPTATALIATYLIVIGSGILFCLRRYKMPIY